MLQMSPTFIRAQRRKARQEREARKGRLGRARFDALAKDLARVIRLAFNAGAIASPLGLEGPLRHGIRADLCLMGWRWRDADAMAAEIVGEALRRVRAVRPTWYEGQPEWTIRPGVLIERTRCAKCHKPLPEGHRRYCSGLCLDAHHKQLARLKEGHEATAIRIATRST